MSLTNGVHINRTSPAGQYTIDQIESALLDVDDLFARVQVPYFILGNIAKQMVSNQNLQGDGLDVGVRRNELRPEVLSTINTFQHELKLNGNEDGFTYFWQGTPIRVTYLDPEDELFKRPDKVWHNAWEYQIANPWEEYEKTII